MEDIYNIFKSKDVFNGGYMRYLKTELARELASDRYIYEDDVYLSWGCLRKGKRKIKKFVSLNEGKGKGSRIFSKFLSKHKNETLWLKVKKENINAIRFYKRFNFEQVKLDNNFVFMECINV